MTEQSPAGEVGEAGFTPAKTIGVQAFTPPTRHLVALSADFAPEGYPGLVELSYLTLPDGGQLGAGLFELRFVRILSPDERGSPIVALQRASIAKARAQ